MDARKIKLVVVSTLILASICTVAVVALKGNMSYEITVGKFYKHAQRYQAPDQGLRVGGELVPETHHQERTDNGVRHTFTIRDKEDKSLELDVVFTGPVPDTMREEGDITVEGKLDENGVLVASKVTPKCASKYDASVESAYEDSKSPSYEPKTYEAVRIPN